MHVQVAVAVHVRKIQAGPAEFFELGGDFIEKLLSGVRAKKVAQAGAGRVGWKSSIFVYQVRDFRWRHNRGSIGAGYVKPDSKAGIFFCESHRMVECLAGDHQACACQNSTAVSKDYGFIHFPGSAEIIPGYNQAAGRHRGRSPGCERVLSPGDEFSPPFDRLRTSSEHEEERSAAEGNRKPTMA
jgi:hypothetical protein